MGETYGSNGGGLGDIFFFACGLRAGAGHASHHEPVDVGN